MKKAMAILHWLVTIGLLVWCAAIMSQREDDARYVDAHGLRSDEALRIAKDVERQVVLLDAMIGELAKVADRNRDRMQVQIGAVAEGVLELQRIIETHREAIMGLLSEDMRRIFEGARQRGERAGRE